MSPRRARSNRRVRSRSYATAPTVVRGRTISTVAVGVAGADRRQPAWRRTSQPPASARRTSYAGWSYIAGPRTTWPSASRNREPCHGHWIGRRRACPRRAAAGVGALGVDGEDRVAVPDDGQVVDPRLELRRSAFRDVGQAAEIELDPLPAGAAPGVTVDMGPDQVDEIAADRGPEREEQVPTSETRRDQAIGRVAARIASEIEVEDEGHDHDRPSGPSPDCGRCRRPRRSRPAPVTAAATIASTPSTSATSATTG